VHCIARTQRAAAVLVVAAACLLSGCAQHAQVICRPLELLSTGDYAGAVQALDETSIADSPLDRLGAATRSLFRDCGMGLRRPGGVQLDGAAAFVLLPRRAPTRVISPLRDGTA